MDDLYSQFPYDDAFRTMEGECDDILIDYVNFCHGTDYKKSDKVIRLRNEHYIESSDRTQKKRVSDAAFGIMKDGRMRKYHHECESGAYDSSVMLRMFEYDTQIALDNHKLNKNELIVEIPIACILFLRNEGDPPDEMYITIRTSGGEVSYPVRVIHMSDIDIDKIFAEKLYFLIPFYIFNMEKSFKLIENDEKKLEQFGDFYSKMFERLEAEVRAGRLSYYSKSIIIRAAHRVAYNLTKKNEIIQRKVGEIMGGEIIEMDVIKAHREGMVEGIEEGREEGRAEGRAEGREEGRAEGRAEGREEGIRVFIEDKLEDAVSEDIILKKLEKNYGLTAEKAVEYIKKYSGVKTA